MDLNSVSQNDALKVQSIDNIVNESLAANSAPMRSTVDIGAPKRGRGRPRKGNAPNRATLAKISAEFEGSKISPAQTPGETLDTTSAGLDPLASGASIKADDIPDSWIEMGLKLPSTIAREFTGFEGFKIGDDTVREAVPLAKECIDLYFPDIERSKHFPAYMLAFVIVLPLCKQTLEYQKFKNAKPVRATVEPNDTPPSAPNHAPKPVKNDEPNPFRQVFT